MKRENLHIFLVLMAVVSFGAQVLIGGEQYFIVGQVYAAASIVCSVVLRKQDEP